MKKKCSTDALLWLKFFSADVLVDYLLELIMSSSEYYFALITTVFWTTDDWWTHEWGDFSRELMFFCCTGIIDFITLYRAGWQPDWLSVPDWHPASWRDGAMVTRGELADRRRDASGWSRHYIVIMTFDVANFAKALKNLFRAACSLSHNMTHITGQECSMKLLIKRQD